VIPRQTKPLTDHWPSSNLSHKQCVGRHNNFNYSQYGVHGSIYMEELMVVEMR
ncbi:hypothetical protein L208DRAFT_1395417, partial [Tricholoma matsutake]